MPHHLIRLLIAAALPMLAVPTHAAAPLAREQAQSSLAAAALRGGQWPLAERLLRQAIAERPADASAWRGLGETLLRLGRAGDARAALARAATLMPVDAALRSLIGAAALDAGMPLEAETAYTAVTAERPADARAWVGLGIARDLLGRHAAAREAYGRALQIDPLSVPARNNLALSFALDGRLQEATDLLAPLAADSARVRNNLQLLQTARGDGIVEPGATPDMVLVASLRDAAAR